MIFLLDFLCSQKNKSVYVVLMRIKIAHSIVFTKITHTIGFWSYRPSLCKSICNA